MTRTIRDILDTDNLNIRELRDAVLNNYELGEDWDEVHLESLKQVYDQMTENGKKLRSVKLWLCGSRTSPSRFSQSFPE